MRISDWSSDVCSSDLGVAEALAVRGDQIVERGDHPLGLIARYGDLACLVDAGRDQHRIVAPAQYVERRVASDLEAEVEVDARLDEPLDPAHHDILLELEAGDAIGQQPAGPVDRKRVVEGKSVSVRVDQGWSRKL